MPAIAAGGIFGLFLLLVLIGLDKEFAEFLRIADIWDIIANSFWGLVLSIISFFWFAWQPTYITLDEKHIHNYTLKRFLQLAIMVTTAVFVAYSIYDTYILMRIANMIELAFETIGRNTQFYFIELIGLGGTILFLSSFVITGILTGGKEDVAVKARKYLMFLGVAVILLLPPLINLFRVLFGIYIPEYGLSARRLFGVYTGVSFLVAAGVFYWHTFKTRKPQFAQVLITFFLTLVVLSFVIPGNYLIAQSQLQTYQSGKQADFEYMVRLRLEKTTFLLAPQIEAMNTGNNTDVYWKYLMAVRSSDDDKAKVYRNQIETLVRQDAQDVADNIQAWEWDEIAITYGIDEAFIGYQGPQIIGARFNLDPSGYAKSYTDNLVNGIEGRYLPYPSSFAVSYTYLPTTQTIQTQVLPSITGVPGQESGYTDFMQRIQPREVTGSPTITFQPNAAQGDVMIVLESVDNQPFICKAVNSYDEPCKEQNLTEQTVRKYLEEGYMDPAVLY